MTPASDAELRDLYRELFPNAPDAAMLHLVRKLDAGYRPAPLPPELDRPLPAPAPDGRWQGRRPAPGSRRWHRLSLPALVAAIAMLGISVVLAASGILNLGKPTDTVSTNQYFPLSGFHRVPVDLRSQGKPELLFIGVQQPYDLISAERWPLIKALTQFGRLTGATAVDVLCQTLQGGTLSGQKACSLPTFDLSHARYTSPYLTFVSKDLTRTVNDRTVLYQHLSLTELQVFNRYARTTQTPQCIRNDSSGKPVVSGGHVVTYPCHSFLDYVEATLNDQGDRTLPLVTIGGYLQTSSQDLNSGDFSVATEVTPTSSSVVAAGYSTPFTFAQVQSALARGTDPASGSRLVEDVNAEANIITALICHADGSKPASVCGRPTIKQILTHVK